MENEINSKSRKEILVLENKKRNLLDMLTDINFQIKEIAKEVYHVCKCCREKIYNEKNVPWGLFINRVYCSIKCAHTYKRKERERLEKLIRTNIEKYPEDIGKVCRNSWCKNKRDGLSSSLYCKVCNEIRLDYRKRLRQKVKEEMNQTM